MAEPIAEEIIQRPRRFEFRSITLGQSSIFASCCADQAVLLPSCCLAQRSLSAPTFWQRAPSPTRAHWPLMLPCLLDDTLRDRGPRAMGSISRTEVLLSSVSSSEFSYTATRDQ